MTTGTAQEEDLRLSEEERFLEVLFANEDLLLAEFDSIILEEWSNVPGAPDEGVPARGHSRPGPVLEWGHAGVQPPPSRRGPLHEWAVQRSPPV